MEDGTETHELVLMLHSSYISFTIISGILLVELLELLPLGGYEGELSKLMVLCKNKIMHIFYIISQHRCLKLGGLKEAIT